MHSETIKLSEFSADRGGYNGRERQEKSMDISFSSSTFGWISHYDTGMR